MAPPTVVFETAKVITQDEEQQFQLIGSCTNEGDLFDKHLFLLEIVDRYDATSDTFKRLCTIADSDEYEKSRDAAVLAGDTYWRANSFSVLFEDVDVAASAKTALNDRIDQLATDHATYLANFYDAGSDYEFPTGTVTALTALIEAYYAAWKAHDAASQASTDADAAVTRLDAAYVAAQNQLNALWIWGETVEDRMQRLHDEMAAASGALSTIVPEAMVAADAMTAFITEFNKNSHPMGLYGVLHNESAGTYGDFTAEINDDTLDDVLLFIVGPEVEDAFFFGADVRFKKINILLSQSGAGVWALTWEYWDGVAWQSLSNVVDGTLDFQAVPGWYDITFDVPSDWGRTALLAGVIAPLFWVRARISAFTNETALPRASKAWVYNAESEEGASYLSHINLDDDLTDLVDAKNALLQDREMALLAVTAAATGVADHIDYRDKMDVLIADYTLAKTSAENALSQATADKLIANRDAAEKLLLLTVAYEAVRAVKSDWVPDAWFPYPGP